MFLMYIKLPFPRDHTESWTQIPKFKIQDNALYPRGDQWSDIKQSNGLKKALMQAVVKSASSRTLILTGVY